MTNKTLFTLAGMTILIVVAFLGFKLLKSSPCDAIFEQTASQLQTKLKLIEAEGEISIGEEKIQDLTEAAQLTALNLKTCCIVLNAGQLAPEQFFQCKDSAKKYEARVDEVVNQLAEVKKERDAGNADAVEEKVRQIQAIVEQAKIVSQTLQRDVETIKKRPVDDQAKQGNRGASQEQEPNNDLFTPNVIPLDTLITGSFADASDTDHYKITTPETYPDVIRIDLENQTTTVKPRIGVYDENKKWLGGTSKYNHEVTSGQDQAYSFSAPPGTVYYISIASLDDNYGGYSLKVSPLRAYDKLEPNNDLLNARVIPLGKTIEANYTDAHDEDYYRIETSPKESTVAVKFENQTTTVKPRIGVYDENKKWLGGTSKYSHEVTAGQNQNYSFPAAADSVYYLYIGNLAKTAGIYKLTVKEQ